MTNNFSKFVENGNVQRKLKNKSRNKEDVKVRSYRMQEEYGPKKFIKPWRTGTKSQQQIPPKGQKKGFRGKTSSSK